MTTVAEPPPEHAAANWWNPGASMQEFHDSDAFIRFLIGGRGTGKTAASGMEAIRHGWHIAGAKAIFLRKTESSQSDTTIETIGKLFDQMGALYQDTGDSLFKSWNNGRTIRIPSRKAVEAFNEALPSWESRADRVNWIEREGDKLCSYIEFRGLPHAVSKETKLRGFECSMLVMIEADQMTVEDFQMAIPCVGRWKGSDPETRDQHGYIIDSFIIVETNPPSDRHWIAKTEEETAKGMNPGYRFWHIRTEENAHNLPPNYVQNLKTAYRNNKAMYKRMVMGEYADAYDGNPVYYAFSPDEHVGEDLEWTTGAFLIRGWDFGTCNAVVWSAYWRFAGVEYWWDLAEQYLEGSDTERQVRAAIQRTENEFDFWNDRTVCAGVLDYCDPAGNNSSYTRQIDVNGKRTEESAIAILNTYGIFPGFTTTARGLQETLATVNRLLETRDGPLIDRITKLPDGKIEKVQIPTGNPVYRIDKKNCPILYRGLCGAYRYPNVGEAGYGNNEPMKGAVAENIDHIQDAARYSKINVLRLMKSDAEKIKESTLKQYQRNPNPKRQD
jgi:hypothetical protein